METQRRTGRKPKASTRDIVQNTAESLPVPAKWRKFFERLSELRDAVLQRRQEAVVDARSENPAFSTHMADAGTDTYDRDLALSMVSSEQDALYQIDQALERIRIGTYGICELTGRPIEPARLEAIPWTRFTADAERQLEKEGARDRTQLGARERVPHESRQSGNEEAS